MGLTLTARTCRGWSLDATTLAVRKLAMTLRAVHDGRFAVAADQWWRCRVNLRHATSWLARAERDALLESPRFAETFCSQCGDSLGPGECGVSHCRDHQQRNGERQ